MRVLPISYNDEKGNCQNGTKELFYLEKKKKGLSFGNSSNFKIVKI